MKHHISFTPVGIRNLNATLEFFSQFFALAENIKYVSLDTSPSPTCDLFSFCRSISKKDEDR